MLNGIYDIKIFTHAIELFNYLDQPDSIVPDVFLMDINLPGMRYWKTFVFILNMTRTPSLLLPRRNWEMMKNTI